MAVTDSPSPSVPSNMAENLLGLLKAYDGL